jgi:hypothetical protein
VEPQPDYELDAYLRIPDRSELLCDLRIWLPRDPKTDGRIAVVAMGVDATSAHPEGLVSLVSDPELEASGLKVAVTEVLVRRSSSRGPRKAGGATLTIAHVGRVRIETRIGVQTGDQSQPRNLKSARFWLSDLEYGRPSQIPVADFLGNRSVNKGKMRAVRMLLPSGHSCEFEIDEHWKWRQESATQISASSSPVLNLLEVSKYADTPLELLTSLADDACALLSLAARHRVVVHTVDSVCNHSAIEEWRNPLSRPRALSEEEACGPLIDVKELETYFLKASSFWADLNSEKRDAIKLAIFSIHPLIDRTLEGAFLAMFSALEGIAKRWGLGNGTLRDKVTALLVSHPAHTGDLWPLFDSAESEVGLYWIRNELAHGRRVGRFAEGAQVLANDHLHLWLEQVLLAVIGYYRGYSPRDWLTLQVPSQRHKVTQMRRVLRNSP